MKVLTAVWSESLATWLLAADAPVSPLEDRFGRVSVAAIKQSKQRRFVALEDLKPFKHLFESRLVALDCGANVTTSEIGSEQEILLLEDLLDELEAALK